MRRSRGPSPRHTARQERQIADYIAKNGVERLPEHVEAPPPPAVRAPKLVKTEKEMEAIKAKGAATRARKYEQMMREARRLAKKYKSQKGRKKST